MISVSKQRGNFVFNGLYREKFLTDFLKILNLHYDMMLGRLSEENANVNCASPLLLPYSFLFYEVHVLMIIDFQVKQGNRK